MFSSQRAVRLLKPIKDKGKKLRADSLTAVTDDDLYLGVDALKQSLDTSSLRRELYRIGERFQTTCCRRPGSPRTGPA